jgi:hypothetical protein
MNFLAVVHSTIFLWQNAERKRELEYNKVELNCTALFPLPLLIRYFFLASFGSLMPPFLNRYHFHAIFIYPSFVLSFLDFHLVLT